MVFIFIKYCLVYVIVSGVYVCNYYDYLFLKVYDYIFDMYGVLEFYFFIENVEVIIDGCLVY